MNSGLFALVVIVLVLLSALCSGLNISLMSLSLADLRRKAKLRSRAARRVLPLRKNLHLTLASILLFNVAVISATSLVLERRFSGLIAGLASTLLIVIFGEVIPQALFASRALAFTSLFAPLLRLMIIVTYPISKPLQLVLDKWIGPEMPHLQSRHELGMMIGEHAVNDESELDEDEIEIIRGALGLSEKRVRDIMTPIENVYWVTPDTLIDGAKIDQITEVGKSRIPVFNAALTRSYGIILMKDLVDHNFDEDPMRIEDMPLYPTQVIGSMTALDTLFRKFINGRTHLIPVEREDEIAGIVTIEDLLEEIVGHEIEDETDRQHTKLRKRIAER